MIQRKQTIWLLLAAILAFVYTQAPIYTAITSLGQEIRMVPTESLLLFALSIAVGLLSATAIFLFKNRPMQIKLALFAMLAAIGLVAAELWQIEDFKANSLMAKANYGWGSLLPIAAIVFLILAIVGIRKDQKLVKSLDRLR